MTKSRIGFCKVKISPPLGTPLAGYEYERYAEKVHDDLFARVIVMDHQDNIIVLIQLDLIGIDYHFMDALNNRLEKEVNIKRDKIFVSCTHTHSGPGGVIDTGQSYNKMLKHSFSSLDEMLLECILRQIVGGVKRCLTDMDGFTLEYANSCLIGVALNRRDPCLPIDNELQVLKFVRKDGKKAVIYNYSCHPTVLDKYNNFISGDFPSEVACLLEKDVEIAAFYNGACGDISTRFTRKESSFLEVKRIGSILGGEVLKLINFNNTVEEIKEFKLKEKTFYLKIKQMITIEEAMSLLEEEKENLQKAIENGARGSSLRLVQSKYEGALSNLHLVEAYEGIEKIPVYVKIIKINDLYLVFIPGELFTKLGLKIKSSLENVKILVVCYANGYVGYIPDIEAYQQGGYEVLTSVIAPGEGERLVEGIIELLYDLQPGKVES